jgi:hypothetical protein
MTAEIIAKALGGRKTGGGWTARCPAHDDREPSLSIRSADGDAVLVRCHAGCEQAAVIGLRHLLKVASRSFGLVVITCRMRDAQGRPSGPLGTALDFVAKQERAS